LTEDGISPHRGVGEILSLCFALDHRQWGDKISHPITGVPGAGRVRNSTRWADKPLYASKAANFVD
jgi:hypothetical protein